MPEPNPNPTFERSNRHNRMNNINLKIGRHFSPGGKYCLTSLGQALDTPASAMQLFAGNPHRYWGAKTSDEDRDKFVEYSSHMYKVVHCCYITNIAEVPSERGAKMTRHCLVNQLEWAERHGCDSMVFHPGSPKDKPKDDAMQWSYEALKEVLTTYEGPVQLLLENAAHPRKIGGHIEDLTQLCEQVGDERLGICIDTTHAWAGGYTIADICTQIIAVPQLKLVHFNQPDAGVTCGSAKDRHSVTFHDGQLDFDKLREFYLACTMRSRHDNMLLPLILEGTPDLPSDLVWMLNWEHAFRTAGAVWPEPAPADCKFNFDAETSSP